jgi:hypothetical protein
VEEVGHRRRVAVATIVGALCALGTLWCAVLALFFIVGSSSSIFDHGSAAADAIVFGALAVAIPVFGVLVIHRLTGRPEDGA